MRYWGQCDFTEVKVYEVTCIVYKMPHEGVEFIDMLMVLIMLLQVSQGPRHTSLILTLYFTFF